MSESASPSTGAQAADPLAPLRTSGVALLTSFRRDGTGVGTPVGISVGDGVAHFTTRAKTWKVKRMARDPRVTLAPCTKTGKVLGATVEGTARRLSDDEARMLRGGFAYRFWTLVYRLVYRDVPVSYEVTPR
ncbi:hypothetical protein HNP84_000398 [Thermocatellispora tengchongensis]|uniref:Pyridoxamine 5'-phosphate oxidase N-terminal domain-containing protein n=1 Tax=Thermocatellispora tengchongensis TaxID=1073253 RepID=A0A840NZW1_9ACTN|nr:PPOX class F420-dependent oxidoreductase [Thermocatellispora tengchongensis]MBB5130710.1 hypothetical protein [Thermocatellispora tengchongensis]